MKLTIELDPSNEVETLEAAFILGGSRIELKREDSPTPENFKPVPARTTGPEVAEQVTEALEPHVSPDAPDTDINDTPWDERIHSSSKKKTAKGVWQRRRNVPNEEFDRIMAELTVSAPKVAPEPVGDGVTDDTEAVQVERDPSVFSRPAPAPEQGAPAQEQFDDWPAFMQFLIAATQAGKYNADAVSKCLQNHGLRVVAEISNRPELWDEVRAAATS
jgi:hypothetical protein